MPSGRRVQQALPPGEDEGGACPALVEGSPSSKSLSFFPRVAAQAMRSPRKREACPMPRLSTRRTNSHVPIQNLPERRSAVSHLPLDPTARSLRSLDTHPPLTPIHRNNLPRPNNLRPNLHVHHRRQSQLPRHRRPVRNGPPISTITPAAARNNGVHAASVTGATRISPGSNVASSRGIHITTRALPVTRPGDTAMPFRVRVSVSSSGARLDADGRRPPLEPRRQHHVSIPQRLHPSPLDAFLRVRHQSPRAIAAASSNVR